jgi:dUTP pyrophosphatase
MQLNFTREDVSVMYGDRRSTGASSGFDLYLPDDTVFPAGSVTFVDFGLQATTYTGNGFFLLARSSLSKTPLRLANSVGLIDGDYRGNLIAALHNTSTSDFSAARGTRLVQIALGTLAPFGVQYGPLNSTERGAGGFGSTGTGTDNAGNVNPNSTEVNFIR